MISDPQNQTEPLPRAGPGCSADPVSARRLLTGAFTRCVLAMYLSEGRYKAAWKREFKLPLRKAGLPKLSRRLSGFGPVGCQSRTLFLSFGLADFSQVEMRSLQHKWVQVRRTGWKATVSYNSTFGNELRKSSSERWGGGH